MRQHEQDILRYLLCLPGERAAQLLLLSALTLEPAPDPSRLVELLLDERTRSQAREWPSSIARLNLRLRQHLDWELEQCELLLSKSSQPAPSQLLEASRALFQTWQKTARLQPERAPDCEAPPWHDLSQPARLKLMRIFLGLLPVQLDTPYPAEACTDWILHFLATIVVGSAVLERESMSAQRLACLFTPGLVLSPTEMKELSEIVTAGGAQHRMHSEFPIRLQDSWLN
ncbi:MAG: hypothetical protein U0931_19565 [Vulcanimicrobiota bacterium]